MRPPTMHVEQSLTVIGVFAVQVLAQGYYVDANRDIYLSPSQSALATANVCFAHAGGPNENPAFLATDSGSSAELTYAGFFHNTYSASLLSTASNLGRIGGIGVSLGYLYVPDILDTRDWATDGDGNPIVPPVSEWQYGTSSEMFLHLSYGKEWRLKRLALSVGVAADVVRRRLLEWTGYGIGLDLGGGVRFPRTGIRIGLLAENITTTYMNWDSNYDEYALPHLQLGLGWERDIPYIYGAIQISYSSLDLLANEGANATDWLSVPDTSETPERLTLSDPAFFFYGNFGIQYTIARVVSLRVGIEDLRRFTFGAGVSLFHDALGVDFAYLAHQLSGSYVASLSYRWR